MIITFEEKGDFEALSAAQTWLSKNGISHGSLCRDDPVGLLRGDILIAKWKNLSMAERQQLDGTITGNFRNGPVTIRLKDEIIIQVVSGGHSDQAAIAPEEWKKRFIQRVILRSGSECFVGEDEYDALEESEGIHLESNPESAADKCMSEWMD